MSDLALKSVAEKIKTKPRSRAVKPPPDRYTLRLTERQADRFAKLGYMEKRRFAEVARLHFTNALDAWENAHPATAP